MFCRAVLHCLTLATKEDPTTYHHRLMYRAEGQGVVRIVKRGAGAVGAGVSLAPLIKRDGGGLMRPGESRLPWRPLLSHSVHGTGRE